MNSAIETIARVQRAGRLISLLLLCVSAYSWLGQMKSRSGQVVGLAVVRQDAGPVLVQRAGVECGHHVHQHPGGEEAADDGAVEARLALDEIDQAREALA